MQHLIWPSSPELGILQELPDQPTFFTGVLLCSLLIKAIYINHANLLLKTCNSSSFLPRVKKKKKRKKKFFLMTLRQFLSWVIDFFSWLPALTHSHPLSTTYIVLWRAVFLRQFKDFALTTSACSIVLPQDVHLMSFLTSFNSLLKYHLLN